MKASSNEPLFVASLPLSLKSSTSFRLSPISSVLTTHLHINTKNQMESQRFLKCLLFQLCAEKYKVDIMQFPAHKLHGWFFSSFHQIRLLFCMFVRFESQPFPTVTIRCHHVLKFIWDYISPRGWMCTIEYNGTQTLAIRPSYVCTQDPTECPIPLQWTNIHPFIELPVIKYKIQIQKIKKKYESPLMQWILLSVR